MIKVGTFNLNNLFSRYNFEGEIISIPPKTEKIEDFTFTDGSFKTRTYFGRLVQAKKTKDTETIANRIKRIDLDIIAVQEVEDIEVLKYFNEKYLGGMYSDVVLVEGNDKRHIDVGILSKMGIGAITSYQAFEHPQLPGERIFSRDLLQVEILDETYKKIFTIYNTHLKSNYVPFTEDQEAGKKEANEKRKLQAEAISMIISSYQDSNSKFILLGDMNDGLGSEYLLPMQKFRDEQLINAIVNPLESRKTKPETEDHGNGPKTAAWSNRYINKGGVIKH